MTESLPKRIGPWRIEAEVGRGMMGVVYKAHDARRRRVAALKVVHVLFPVSEEERTRFEKRFIQEGRIVARLSHEGIVGVYDVGRDKRDGVPYMALEYLEGQTLASILADGPAPTWRESLALVAQVADALHYAHGQGVIHRDIKPANIMVLPSGRAKIMDFGLAKHEAGIELTSTGQFMGTPLYMSPEQALGERLDSRSDLFSLGSVAYTLLTGRRAFEADSVPQVMSRVAHRSPPAPSRVSSALPPEVDYLVARSMAKRRPDRYPSGRMFAEDIEDVLKGRPPRHSGGWIPPAVGEGTQVSTREPGRGRNEDDADMELEPLEEAPRRRSAVPLQWLGLALIALAAIVFQSPFWLERIGEALDPAPPAPVVAGGAALPAAAPPPAASPSPRASPAPETALPSEAETRVTPSETSPAAPPTEDDVVVDEESAQPVASPTTPAEEEAAASVPPATVAEEPAPSPTSLSPVAGSVPLASSPSSAPHAQPPTARLSISFEHGIESGTLRVLVDRKAVLQQRLTSHVTKDLLLFKLRSGVVRDTLRVAPGRRRIRVEVKTEDETRAKETIATFRDGATRRLAVKIGRLRGNLSLAWK